MKAYDLGYKKIMRELDITKLIKSIKNVRNIMKKKFKNDNDLLTIQHDSKNMIYLDISSDDIYTPNYKYKEDQSQLAISQ